MDSSLFLLNKKIYRLILTQNKIVFKQMSTVFAKNVNWRFAQAPKLDFVEKVKSGANFLTLLDIGVKSTIICCIQQRIQQI